MAHALGDHFQSPPKIVHYTEFWYSARIPGSAALDDLSTPENASKRHLRNIRVLSLFFENIFFSRSHLLTNLDQAAKEIIEHTLANRDISALIERGILKTAARPGLDGISDTQRTIDRNRRLEIGIAPNNQATQRIVTTLPVIAADSRTESRATLEIYKEIANTLRRKSNALAKEFEELLALAETPDAPFLHEVFASLLQATAFPEQLKLAIWQKTNSIYLTGGATFSQASIDYHHGEYEGAENVFFRGIDRRTYRPDTLLSYIGYLTSAKDVNALLQAPIEKFLELRSEGNCLNFLWPDFVAEYFDLVREVSDATLLSHQITGGYDSRISEMIIASFEGRLHNYSGDVVSAATHIARGVAQSLDPSLGVGAEVASRGAQTILKSGASALTLRLKRGRTYRFTKLLRSLSEK